MLSVRGKGKRKRKREGIWQGKEERRTNSKRARKGRTDWKNERRERNNRAWKGGRRNIGGATEADGNKGPRRRNGGRRKDRTRTEGGREGARRNGKYLEIADVRTHLPTTTKMLSFITFT